ncbi:hypothetical protein SALBM311S_09973 [Streptomyces alboniger]
MLPLETAVAPGNGSGLRPMASAPEALARDSGPQQDVDRVIAALEAIPAQEPSGAHRARLGGRAVLRGACGARGPADSRAGHRRRRLPDHQSLHHLPGLDIALANQLALRNDVMLLPATQWACVAGTRSLALAADLVAADPDRVVLVVDRGGSEHDLTPRTTPWSS